MAMLRVLLAAVLATIFLIEATTAANHAVGAPNGGWDLTTNLTAWASTKTFTEGDNLIFSYNPLFHNVLEVTKTNFDTCTASNPKKKYSTGKDVIVLSSEGTKYFICGVPGHCVLGMKLRIDTVAAPAPSPTTSSPSVSPSPRISPSISTAAPPSDSPVNYAVGAPNGGWDLATNLTAWASTKTFTEGDNLIFSYNPSFHNVLEVTKTNFDTCTASNPKKKYTTGKDVIVLSSEGTKYFICGVPGHCALGMKLRINTVAAPATSPTASSPSVSPSPRISPSISTAAPPSDSPVNYAVGAPRGSWDLTTNLTAWASTKTFTKGDSLIFSYNPSFHNVLEVTKTNFDTCTTSSPKKKYTTGKDVIALSSVGTKYFICGIPGHCVLGMKVQIDTVAAPATSPTAPSPSVSQSPRISPSTSIAAPPSNSPANKPIELAPIAPIEHSPLPAPHSGGANGHVAVTNSSITFVFGLIMLLFLSF